MDVHHRFKSDCSALLQEELSSGRLSRRGFLTASAALGVASFTGQAVGDAHAQTETITLCNYGGPSVEAMKTALIEPFTAKTGVEVQFDTSGPISGVLRKMVDDKAAIWDLIDGGPELGYQLGGDYFEKIDYSIVDKSKILPGAFNDYAAGSYVYSNVLTYDSEVFKDAPKSWVDFFDLQKFPGKRAMFKWFNGAPEACLLGAGVAPDKIYPIDWDLVRKMLDKLGNNLVLWDSGAISMQLFLDHEIVMGNLYNTRARVLERNTKGRVKWLWNQQILAPAAWQIPKGSKHIAAAQNFIASAQAPEGQIKLLDSMGNGPVNPAAIGMLNDEQKRINPTSHLETALLEDLKWYGANYDDALDKWMSASAR